REPMGGAAEQNPYREIEAEEVGGGRQERAAAQAAFDLTDQKCDQKQVQDEDKRIAFSRSTIAWSIHIVTVSLHVNSLKGGAGERRVAKKCSFLPGSAR